MREDKDGEDLENNPKWRFHGYVLTSTPIPETDAEIDMSEPATGNGEWAHALESNHATKDGAVPVIVSVWAAFKRTKEAATTSTAQAENSGEQS